MNREGSELLHGLLERITAPPAPRREPDYFTRRSQHRMYQRRNYGRPKCR